MAQALVATYTCDYDLQEIPDGQQRIRRVRVDGRRYEVHLCAPHSACLNEVLTRVDAAPGARRPASGRTRSAAIRAWAIREGLLASDRGRIPALVIAQYDARGRS